MIKRTTRGKKGKPVNHRKVHDKIEDVYSEGALTEMKMSASEGQQAGPAEAVSEVSDGALGGSTLEPAIEDSLHETAEKKTPIDPDAMDVPEDMKDLLASSMDSPFTDIESTIILGDQPNGTYGVIVTIPEGHIEGIRQQAESDNCTVEEWISIRLGEYLEQWWAPAQGR